MANISLEDLMKNRQANTGLAETAGEETPEAAKPRQLTEEERKKVDSIKNSLNVMDSQACIQFGTSAQRNISDFADSILNTVRSKDSGYVGELLQSLVSDIRDADFSAGGDDEGILDKIPLFSSAKKKLEKMMMRYEKLEVQIDQIEGKLDQAKMEMLKDIGMFDMMYEKNLEYFQELNLYITAGEERIRELREQDIPGLKAQAAASPDPMAAQLVHDFEENVNRFEKKVHDLKLSRTIAIQTAPQIRLIQNNDKLLVDKIQTAVLNTIPIWKSQIVIALGLGKQQKVLKLNQEISETTNELLKRNSELLKTNTIETAKEAERSVVDMETLKKTNENLIAAIEETLSIQKEGREKRQAAEAELNRLEGELKDVLRGAKQRESSEAKFFAFS